MKKLFAVLMTLTLALVLLPASLASGEYEITAPEGGSCVLGDTTFEATYTGEDADGVQWAVRYETCDANTNTVFGNVDGFSDTFTWAFDGEETVFSATADTSTWNFGPGEYCFVFNPNNGGRYTRWFVVGEYGAEWLPPITLDDWTLNENATLPIKFQLFGCGSVLTENLNPTLTVYFEGGSEEVELRFDEDEYHYIGNFRPTDSGAHTAVVELDDLVVGEQAFDVVEPGQANGRGKGK